MAQADPAVIRNPSRVTPHLSGERYILDNRAAPRVRRAEITAMLDRLLAAVEDLLAELDAIDGDPDLEDGGDDEHDLALGMPDIPTDREHDDADDEPSLGLAEVYLGARMVDGNAIWPEQSRVTDGGFDQSRWGMVAGDDREEEHDGREPAAAPR